ncbi:NACHT domain-containing protein [Streptomyces chartreusis]|uniref:NACHT domain-containing protein n=1 Tax=Streptomyces chartreusis TaxID=1969 RepID=UPI0038033572
MAAALALAYIFDFGVPQTVATALFALAPSYIAWASFRGDEARPAPHQELGETADRLADAVRTQWETEVQLWHVNDPYPLPVSWRTAPERLVESWSRVRAIVAAWPEGPPGDPDDWPAEPEGLAGADAEITDVFLKRVPTRRLVVLGPPGAGKTMLLVRLVLGVLARRRRDGAGPVPVLFPLSSWNPREQDFYSWMADRLMTDYRQVLDNPSQARALLDARGAQDGAWILPVLDGFDEIDPAVRPAALARINQALPLGHSLVLSSRPDEFERALTPEARVPTPLAGTAGIQIEPLSAQTAADYLVRTAGGEHAPSASRWDPVLAELGTDSAVGRTLETPLMLYLARTVYNPRPEADIRDAATGLPDPSELCGRVDATEVRAHLLDAYIGAVYREDSERPSSWTPEQARRTLIHLATHQEDDIAWWDLHTRERWVTLWLPVAVLVGVTLGVATGMVIGPWYGGIVAFFATVLFRKDGTSSYRQPASGLGWSWFRPVYGLVLLLFWGPVVYLAAGGPSVVGSSQGSERGGFVDGLMVVLVVWLTYALMSGWTFSTAWGSSAARASSPTLLWVRDRRASCRRILLNAGTGGIFGALFGWLADGPVARTWADEWAVTGILRNLNFDQADGTLFGASAGLTLCIYLGFREAFNEAACYPFAIARCHWVVRRGLPFDLMEFLADAHERRGVLRQVGAVYQFRHIELRRQLAAPGMPLRGAAPSSS